MALECVCECVCESVCVCVCERVCVCVCEEGRKEMFYLTMYSTHSILRLYGVGMCVSVCVCV